MTTMVEPIREASREALRNAREQLLAARAEIDSELRLVDQALNVFNGARPKGIGSVLAEPSPAPERTAPAAPKRQAAPKRPAQQVPTTPPEPGTKTHEIAKIFHDLGRTSNARVRARAEGSRTLVELTGRRLRAIGWIVEDGEEDGSKVWKWVGPDLNEQPAAA